MWRRHGGRRSGCPRSSRTRGRAWSRTGDYDGLRFDGTDLTDASGRGARFLDCALESCALDRTELARARFIDSVLTGVRGVGTDLAEASLRDVEVVDARLGGVQLHGAVLERVVVRGGKIDYLNLRKARLKDVVFEGCVLSEPDFGDAHLVRVEFRDCVLKRADLSGVRLESVDLRAVAELDIARGVDRLAGAVISPPVVEVGQGQPGGGSPGVLPYVGQGPLGDAQQSRLDPVRQRRGRGPLHMAADGERPRRLGALAGRQRVQGRLQAAAPARSAGARSWTKRRASARLRSAMPVAVRTWRRAASGSASQVRSAAWSSICWLDRPCARVSWISMESRWRSARVPSRRSVAASSRRVRSRSPISSRWRAASSRWRTAWRRMWTKTAVATAATAGGAAPGSGRTRSPGAVARPRRTREQGDERERRARRQDAQPGVEQRHRAPGETRRQHDQHHPHDDEHPEPGDPARGGARPEDRAQQVQHRQGDRQRDDPRGAGLARVPHQEPGQRGPQQQEERGVHEEGEPARVGVGPGGSEAPGLGPLRVRRTDAVLHHVPHVPSLTCTDPPW
ncbi:hypothetical protein SCALM49S_01838 [Streptomyces californicus]